MSDRLTAEPGTVEFWRQLLEVAQKSDHPMDKVLAKRITEAANVSETEKVAGD